MKEVISEKFVLGFGCYCEQVREWRVGGRGIKQNLEQCCCKDEILSRITSRDYFKKNNVDKKYLLPFDWLRMVNTLDHDDHV